MLPLLLACLYQEHRLAFSSYVLSMDPTKDPSVAISRNGRVIWRGIKKAWKPWKVIVADIDVDGKPEFAVGLFKSTKYLPEPHNCVFVYGIDGNIVVARWKGSSLGQPFFDYAFVPRKGRKPVMVTVNALLNGTKCLAGYVWNGFGFDKEWQQGSWKTLEIVKGEAPFIVVRADGEQLKVRVS
jgi:hypothetical protein